MRRGLEILGTAALAVAVLGISLLPLLTPAFTAALSTRFSLAQDAGLSEARMLDLAEQVRSFVVEREGTLPATVEGRAAFDASAVSHLEDVAAVIGAARVAIVIALAVFVACVVVVGRVDRVGSLGRMSVGAGLLLIGLGALAAVVGLTSFDALFAWFHSLFFAAGTWTFPYDSLLIQLFPEPFWVWGGVAWAMGVVASSALLIAVGALLVRRSKAIRA